VIVTIGVWAVCVLPAEVVPALVPVETVILVVVIALTAIVLL